MLGETCQFRSVKISLSLENGVGRTGIGELHSRRVQVCGTMDAGVGRGMAFALIPTWGPILTHSPLPHCPIGHRPMPNAHCPLPALASLGDMGPNIGNRR